MPTYDREEFESRFDDENPEIDIPTEKHQDVDNDWLLEEAEQDALVAQYWGTGEEAQ